MRYLFLSEYFHPFIKGGGELNLIERCKGLIKEGHDVTVLTSKLLNLDDGQYKGITVLRRFKTGLDPSSIFSNIKRMGFLKSMKKEIQKINFKDYDEIYISCACILIAPDINHKKLFLIIENLMSICPKSNMLCNGNECNKRCNMSLYVACQMNDNNVGKMNNPWFLKFNPLFWMVIFNRFKKMNNALRFGQVITVSKFMQKKLLLHGINSILQPNFINPEMFYPRTIPNNTKTTIMCFGSLNKYRGFHIVDKAIKNFDNEIIQAAVYGEGPECENYKRLIVKDPIDYEDVPLWMAMADIIIIPSLFPEPEGRVAREALMMGKKVIVSDIGALHYLEGVEKVSPGNVNELTNAIYKYIKEKEVSEK